MRADSDRSYIYTIPANADPRQAGDAADDYPSPEQALDLSRVRRSKRKTAIGCERGNCG